MDRVPLEVYRLIVSMVDDEAGPFGAPERDSGPCAAAADVEASQTISNTQVVPHANSSRRHSSSIAESTKNMQRRLQNRLAAFQEFRLLRLIRQLCATVPTTGREDNVEMVPTTRVNRLATLKSLRLCNKKLAVMTAEFLFEEVLLHFTEESHAKLEAISQHTYRRFVRVLHLVPKAISGPRLQKKEFGRWLRGKRTLIDNALVSYAGQDYAGPLIMPDHVKISRKAINFHYREYSSLYADQRKLFATAEGVLQAAIGRLPQLKRVESGLYWEWSRRRPDIPPDDFELNPGRCWHFRRLDISPTDDTIDRIWKAGARQTNFDADQGAMVLRAVAHGRATSGARIDAGPLFRDLSTTATRTANPKDHAALTALMADTRHFNFYLKQADLDEARGLVASGHVARFLQTMPRLESLRFRSAYLDTEDRLHEAFGAAVTWPRLASLSVKCADQFDFGGLAALIRRHRASLRRLALYDVYHDYDARCDVSARLHAGALDTVRISNLCRRAGSLGLDWRDEGGYAWARAGPAHVFSGGAWSPRLGCCLREELVAKVFPSFAHAQVGLLAEDEDSVDELDMII